jgi:hypothetical protein
MQLSPAVANGRKRMYPLDTVLKLFLAASTLTADPALGQQMTCRWNSKQQCGPGAACRPAANKVWATADPAATRYQRCDAKGCDGYDSVVSTSGAFMTYALPGRGMFIKVGPDGAATEVVSLGNSVVVSQGQCRPAPGESQP